MMKKIFFVIIILVIGFWGWKFFRTQNKTIILKHTDTTAPAGSPLPSGLSAVSDNYEKLKTEINDKYKNITPKIWSETAPGVVTKLDTNEKVLALTFDACGSDGDGYDKDLIDYLTQEKIPATLFITGKWIDKNSEMFENLAKNPNFEIENHGTKHIPCSISGKSAYNIKGENSPGEVVDEIELNARKIEALTGKKPKFYRVGTTFTDEVCPEIASDLGYKIISFFVNGDGGATYDVSQIKNVTSKIPAGSIVLMHMNHPDHDTAEGVKVVVPELLKEGYKFVKLEDYE